MKKRVMFELNFNIGDGYCMTTFSQFFDASFAIFYDIRFVNNIRSLWWFYEPERDNESAYLYIGNTWIKELHVSYPEKGCRYVAARLVK